MHIIGIFVCLGSLGDWCFVADRQTTIENVTLIHGHVKRGEMCCHDKIQIYNHLSTQPLSLSNSHLNNLLTPTVKTNMANTITTQELEILSNKAISAKSTAYCKSQDVLMIHRTGP